MEYIVNGLRGVIEQLEDVEDYIDECENYEALQLYQLVLQAYFASKVALFQHTLKQYETPEE